MHLKVYYWTFTSHYFSIWIGSSSGFWNTHVWNYEAEQTEAIHVGLTCCPSLWPPSFNQDPLVFLLVTPIYFLLLYHHSRIPFSKPAAWKGERPGSGSFPSSLTLFTSESCELSREQIFSVLKSLQWLPFICIIKSKSDPASNPFLHRLSASCLGIFKPVSIYSLGWAFLPSASELWTLLSLCIVYWKSCPTALDFPHSILFQKKSLTSVVPQHHVNNFTAALSLL